MINEVILHQGGSLSICLQASHGGLAVSPSPHPSPKIYRPKKKYFCLSAGNTAKFMYKGAFYETDNTKEIQNIPYPDPANPYQPQNSKG